METPSTLNPKMAAKNDGDVSRGLEVKREKIKGKTTRKKNMSILFLKKERLNGNL